MSSVAALAADLPPFDMSPLEKAELPRLIEAEGVYLSVRNSILCIWQDDLNQFVTLEVAEKDIQVSHT